MDKRTKQLFEWAAANSQTEQQAGEAAIPQNTSKLDSGIINAILGPDDSQLMIESMQAIKNESLSLDDRLTAFENLEMLVEQIDNASNLDTLKLWPPLLSMLSSPEPDLRRYAAWVIGTAVQNNQKAQTHLHQYKGVKKLVERLDDDEYRVKTKILYALGSQLHHFPPAARQFEEVGGWGKLRGCLEDVDEGSELQRRVAFFLANYLADEGVDAAKIQEHGFLERFIEILKRSKDEADLRERVLQAVHMLMRRTNATEEHKADLKGMLPGLKEQHPDALDHEQWHSLENQLSL